MTARPVTRVEVKHAMPEPIAADALAWSAVFLPPDPAHAGVQRVTSLYLDSPEWTFYRWHREGRRDRFKLRLREYGDVPGEHVYAEIKQKMGVIGRKTRAPMPVSLVAALLDPRSAGVASDGAGALDEFVARRRAYAAAPAMVVRSMREALRDTGPAGEYAVTVDRRIHYATARRHDEGAFGRPSQARSPSSPAAARSTSELSRATDEWTALALPCRGLPADAIVELKYAGQPPAWMATLLLHMRPYRVSFSKYAAAVQQHAAWSRW